MTEYVITCPSCEGIGAITRTVQIDPIPFGGNDPLETFTCTHCDGAGKIGQADYDAFLAELSPNDETAVE